MTTATNQEALQQSTATLQVKKKLLPIDEYAAREGLSVGIVQECGKLGIVQLRRFKGKMYVVDVPLSPYRYPSETPQGPAQPVNKTDYAKKISELTQNLTPSKAKSAKVTKKPDEWGRSGMISELVTKMFNKSLAIKDKTKEAIDNKVAQPEKITQPVQTKASELLEIIAKPKTTDQQKIETKNIPAKSPTITRKATTAKKTSPAERFSEPVHNLDLDTIDIMDEELELNDKAVETEVAPKPRPTQSEENEEFQAGFLAARTKSKRNWQVTAVLSLVFLFPALFANLWFYMDRKIQSDRVDQAYASIQKVYNDFTQTRRHSESIQKELDASKGEIQHLQNELAKSTAALQTLRSQLNLARINLETSQQQNATAVNQLKEQIQNLTDRIAELNKGRGATSGPLHQSSEPTPESLLPLIQFQMQQK